MSANGKGDKQRPCSISADELEERWTWVFGRRVKSSELPRSEGGAEQSSGRAKQGDGESDATA